MPIYVYECDNKHRFEKWQSMKDDALKDCPECGASVRRILQPAGIIFKGSGWYITDSRKSDSGSSDESKATKSDTKSESKSEGGEAKSETKSEAKSSSTDSKSESKPAPASSSGSESKPSSS